MSRSTRCSRRGAPQRGPDPRRKNRCSLAPPLREAGGAAEEGGAGGEGAAAPARTVRTNPIENERHSAISGATASLKGYLPCG